MTLYEERPRPHLRQLCWTIAWFLPKSWMRGTHLKPTCHRVLPSVLWILLQVLGDLCWHGCSIYSTWPNHSSKNVHDLPGPGQLPLQWWWVNFLSPPVLDTSLQLPRFVRFSIWAEKTAELRLLEAETKHPFLGRYFIEAVLFVSTEGSVSRDRHRPHHIHPHILTRRMQLRGNGTHTWVLHSQVGCWA